MQSHGLFDIQIHSNDELETLLDIEIDAREQMHIWPLSSLELVTDREGNRVVYKAQLEPTVEPEFYEQARSRSLVDHRILTRDSFHATMVFEFCDLPRLGDRRLSDGEWVRHGRAVVDAIGTIEGDLPSYVDVGSSARWRDLVEPTLETLSDLQSDGRFPSVAPGDISMLERWAWSDAVTAAVDTTSRITQGDCKADHVFLVRDGYRIVDWQRPYVCPADVDLVTFLEDKGIDPAPHVRPEVCGIRWFLHLHWAVEAKAHLLPELELFDEWAGDAISHIRTLANR